MESTTGSVMQYFKAILLGFFLVFGSVATTLSYAQNGDDDQEEEEKTETLNPRIARDLLEAYEALKEENYAEGLLKLNTLLETQRDYMKPFDLASVLQIRGSALVNMDRYDEALRDFKRALELNALPRSQNIQLMFNVAQLYFQQENYREAIRYLKQWIAAVDEPNHNAYYMLAAGYYYLEQYDTAIPHAEHAIELLPEPNKRYYDLANILYSQTKEHAKRADLLETMVTYWASDASYWKQLAALYNELGRERRSFSTLEIAYRNGLLTTENDIVPLAQYYSLYNNPYRGAILLEKEMKAENVERSVENLELLSQLWSQAREHKKAIPVLREAAKLSDEGELSFRLGQVLLADEQNKAAEAALETAIEKGGLTDNDKADAWLLLGTARFNQAGPGDKVKRANADEAFKIAQRFKRTREQATQWRSYITAINNTERRQAALEAKQKQEIAESARERALTACRAQRLAGTELSQRCLDLFAEEDEKRNREEQG